MTNKTKVFTRHLIRLLIAIALSSTLLAVPSPANASANSIIDNPSRPTLIFVFQPFCQYCKRAAPFVAQLHAQLGADMDFVMVTDYADYTSYSNSFRSDFGLTMPLIEDRGLDMAKYKIYGYPNFLWSVPGKGVTNWGPVGYNADDWARRDVPKLLRLAKYGPPPEMVSYSTIKVGARPVVGQVDVSWSPVTAETPITHYEVRARKAGSRNDTDEEVFGVSGVSAAIRFSNAKININYLVAVRAISPAGTGEWSEETSVLWPTSPANKTTTITCKKGKIVKKVTALKPVCPKGYKKA